MSSGTVPRLEQELGDPFEPENPFSFARALAADENGELSAATGEVLGARNFLAELVPSSRGGSSSGTENLAGSVRALFRRDPCVAVSWAVAPLAAAAQVWESGTPSQQGEVAATLLAGEPLEGNVLGDPLPRCGEVLHGTTRFVRAATGASHVVLRGRSADGRWRAVLLDRADLPPGSTLLTRRSTSGLRACAFGGLDFSDAAVPAASVLTGDGPAGPGVLATVVRAAGSLGVLETALHVVCEFATGRRLYGQAVSDIPHAQGMLAGAFADLLAADCLVTWLLRELDAGRRVAAAAAPVEGFVADTLVRSMEALSVVLGARFYLREGPGAMVGKLYRDFPVLRLLRNSPAAARQCVALAGEGADPNERLGEVRQPSLGPLLRAPRDDEVGDDVRSLEEEADRVLEELEFVRAGGTGADPSDLVRRYGIVAAAVCCHDMRADPTAPPGWTTAAATRLLGRLGLHSGVLSPGLADEMFAGLARRVSERRSPGLRAEPVFR